MLYSIVRRQSGRIPFLMIIITCLFSAAVPAAAQNVSEGTNTEFLEGFFVDAGIHYYFTPEVLTGVVEQDPGFRGALGYSWRGFRFSVSSGFSRFSGISPLVESVLSIPLTGRVGYALPIIKGNGGDLGLQLDLGGGVQFANTSHYKTDLDMRLGKKSESWNTKPFAESRLYVTYVFPFKFLGIYAGGGLDLAFEEKGLIPMPLMEAGISIKPFLIKKKPDAPVPATEPKEQEPQEEPEPQNLAQVEDLPDPETEVTQEPETNVANEPEPEPQKLAQAENVSDTKTETKAEPEKDAKSAASNAQTEKGRELSGPILYQTAVYFEGDIGSNVDNQYLLLLREVGRQLQASPQTQLVLRGYAAPRGTEESQVTISAARVWFCAELLKREYRIPEERMNMLFFGAEGGSREANLQLQRRVDLIIIDQ